MIVAQIKVVEAVAKPVFIFKEESKEFPDGLDVGYERRTESNMTPKFLTQASGSMQLPSVEEEKVTGEVCLEYVRWGEEEKSGVQVEYVEFEIFLRLSSGNAEQALETQVWDLGGSELEI